MHGRPGKGFFTGMLAAAAALSVGLAPSGARAQVNAESLRQDPLKPGFGANLDTSLSLARGNVTLFDVGAGGRLQYQTLYPAPPQAEGQTAPLPFLHHRILVAGNGRYSENGSGPFVSQTYLHMRWTGMWHPRVGSDVFVQWQNNRFFRLQRRSLAGAGARFEIVHHPALLWWGGTAYMLEYEQINVQPGAPDAPETLSHRWTSYLTERFSFLGGRFLLQSTTYIQPRFDDFSDFRLLEEVEAQGKVTDVVSFGFNLSVLHDSAPPTGVQSTDLRMSSGIHLSY
ncbi:MAG: DUF481 domain-containing protein [Polyangiaceae bacterium]